MTGFEYVTITLLSLSILLLVALVVILSTLLKKVAAVDTLVKKGLDDIRAAAILLVGKITEESSTQP